MDLCWGKTFFGHAFRVFLVLVITDGYVDDDLGHTG